MGNLEIMGKIMRFRSINNPIDPSIHSLNVYSILIVFVFTFIIEGVGLWYLLRILNFNIRLKLTESLALTFVLNLVTFFFGNYILLPFLR